MIPGVRRACALLLAAGFSACGGKVVVDGLAATDSTGTASAGNGGSTGIGGDSTGSAPSGSGSSGTTSGGGGYSGGTGSGGSSVIPLAYTLTEYVTSPQALWKGLVHTSAIDSSGRLFVSDGEVVYAIKDGVPSIYLTYAELKTAASDDLPSISSLDVGPDDRLYILDGGAPYNILVSHGPHDAALHLAVASESLTWPDHIGVESPDRVLLVTSEGGLYEVTVGGTKQVYTSSAFQNAMGCGVRDFAVTQNGYFYFLPGCTNSPILGGTTKGGSVDVLVTLADLDENYAWWFGAVAHHPKGGAVANLTGTAYYLDASGKPTELSMNPAMSTIKETGYDFPLFDGRPIEVGASGEIYLIGSDRIYCAIPQ